MKTVLVLIGTRPEAIKLAPVIHSLRRCSGLRHLVVSTGQHKEMMGEIFERFSIAPDQELSSMRAGQSLSELTARLASGLDAAFGQQDVDFCLVQGDTTTTLVGSLVAFYRRVPVGHVEAGLRTGDLTAPFPEEANRRMVTQIATLHFAPTEMARNNLVREGVEPRQVFVTGNTSIDALRMELARQDRDDVNIRNDLSSRLGAEALKRPYVLITGHRRENFGRGFDEICDAILDLSLEFPDHDFIYPVHLNPSVQVPVRTRLGGLPNLKLLAPLGYSEFVTLMRHCRLVLTDSGGIQEEAPGLGKPVLVMRDKTERPEGLLAGTVRLVGADRSRIVEAVGRLLRDEQEYEYMARATNPYGDGLAAERIVAAVAAHLAEGS